MLLSGDEQLAQALVRHAALLAVGVQAPAALQAQLGLEAARRVVDACTRLRGCSLRKKKWHGWQVPLHSRRASKGRAHKLATKH